MPLLLLFGAGVVVGAGGTYVASDAGQKLVIGGALAAGLYLYWKRG